jgi:DNA-3-methyladenine glycosylase I
MMTIELKKQGLSFVGTTICYAFMQAVGMINVHTTNCFCYKNSISDAKY